MSTSAAASSVVVNPFGGQPLSLSGGGTSPCDEHLPLVKIWESLQQNRCSRR
jgi:hypothetical protein